MTDRPTCETCAYMVERDTGRTCRRYAPRPQFDAADYSWPWVLLSDWCGEHVPADFMEPDPVDVTPPTLGRPKI